MARMERNHNEEGPSEGAERLLRWLVGAAAAVVVVGGMRVAAPLLTQVLGFREEAGDLLSLIKRNALIPVIVRPAEDREVLLEGQQALFAEEMYLANLYEAVRAAKSGRDAIHACSRGVIKI